MKRLSGLDAAFLYMETPSQHMHVCATMVLAPQCDRSNRIDEDTAIGRYVAAGRAKETARRISGILLRRLVALPPFRRSLAQAPLRLTHPAWINSVAFDPADHATYERLPLPGTDDQLADLIGSIAATPLDRRRPLWNLWAITGLDGGRIAVVVKVHHAMLDGVSGLELLARLFTTEAEGIEQAPIDATIYADHCPSPLRRAASLLTSMSRGPRNVKNALAQTGLSLLPLARGSVGLVRSTLRLSPPLSSPRTSLNRALTPKRAVAFGRVSLESVKRIKNAFGVTINDVVLASCTIALRDYLRARGECPQRAIIATVPVSHHVRGETRVLGNRVSAMFIGLPVHLEMATDVLRTVHEQSVGAKKLHTTFAPSMLADWAELASPALFTGAAALFSRWKLAEHLPPAHSVVISNIAGPPMSLYAGDARLVAAYPLGPILEGAVVNITVVSYAGSVDIGVITCPKSVPRPSEIARAFECAIAHLADGAAISSAPSPTCADAA